MAYLGAAAVATGVLCLVNLMLLFAVIRKLRRYDERLARRPDAQEFGRLPAGAKLPDFTAMTMTGQSRSLADLAGARSLVGFFSPGCPPCRTQLPVFAEFARTIPGGTGQVLAVLAGNEKDAMEFAAELDGVSSVVIEARRGALATAFSVPGYPAFFLIGADSRIEASAPAVRMLTRRTAPGPVPAGR